MLSLGNFLILFAIIASSRADTHGEKTEGVGKPPWNTTATDTLKRTLLAGYDKFARPSHHKQPTNVSIGLTIYHVQVDDNNGVMTIHGWVKMAWNDDKLKWNSSDYGELVTLHVGDHEIWQPDIVQYNSASGNAVDQYGNTHCLVNSDGSVLWVPPTKMTAFCSIDLVDWPNDEHVCSYIFGSWTYDGTQINLYSGKLYNEDTFIEHDHFIQNAEWDLLNVSYEREERTYSCCEDAIYASISYGVRVKRRGETRANLLKLQAAVAVILALLAHWLPPNASQPRALLATIPPALIASALFYFAQKLPPSFRTPHIVIFYSASLYVVCASAVVSVIVLNIARSRKSLPWAARRVLSSTVGSLFVPQDTHHGSGSEELQVGSGQSISRDADGPPPTRGWISFAILFDRISFFLLLLVYVLIFFIYGC